MSRFRPQSESEVIYEEEEKKDLKARGMEHVKPVWELRETYLQNVARAEEAEREARDRGEDVDDDGWWL